MATKTSNAYTAEQKAAILKAANDTSVAQAAKDHGVAEGTIYTWRKAGAKAGKKRQAKKRRSKRASKPVSNGFRLADHLPEQPAPDLATLETQLATALQSVRSMRTAFRTVFGGA